MNQPPSDHFIPYGRQWIDEADVEAVADALRSDWLTTGPRVEAFEGELARCTNAGHAVAVNSGTAALHTAYAAVGVTVGCEVITSPMTFAATANAALYLGADVRFVDVDPRTGLLDADELKEAVGERTAAIAAVDYAGHPADYEAIGDIADDHGVPVVADACHSLGARRRGQPVGTLADVTAFSFHPVKPITTGEGGAVVTDDAELARRMRRFRNHGITRDRRKMEEDRGPWHYEMHELGHNYRMTDLQCALGTSQLRRLDELIARRRHIAGRYLRAFASIDAIALPYLEQGVASGWHLFVIRVDDGPDARKSLFQRLRKMNLGVQVHYPPVYWHPYYRQIGFRRGSCPRAERFYEGAISLPLFPAMSDVEVEAVIDRVRRACREVLR